MTVNTGAELQAVTPSLSAASVENPANTSFALMSDSQKIESAVSSSKVTYANAFGSGINLEYGIRAYAVKENVILQNANTGFRGYKMQVTALGLIAQKDEYNTITFADSEGNVKFTIEAPYMMDAEDNVSGDITVTVTQTANGYDITYIPNAQWLNTATYPVVIDPQATSSQSASNLLDTYTYEGDSTSNAVTRQNQDRMYVGNKSVSGTRKKHIGYFKFITLPTLPGGATFNYASVTLKFPNGTSTSQPLDLYAVNEDWVTNTLTWSSKPEYDSSPVYVAGSRNAATDYITFLGRHENVELSNLIGEWYSFHRLNYGFMVCYTSASDAVADYNALYTSNCSTTEVRPYMITNYSGDMEGDLEEGTYYIRNISTGKYLTVQNNAANGATVSAGDFTAANDQKWHVTMLSDGYYQLAPAAGSVSSPVFMTVKNASTLSGTSIIVNREYGGYEMMFSINLVPSTTNHYTIGTRVTGGDCVVGMTVTNVVAQMTASSSTLQQWMFIPATKTLNTPLIGQEGPGLCWAACSLMVAKTYEQVSTTQNQLIDIFNSNLGPMDLLDIEKMDDVINYLTDSTAYCYNVTVWTEAVLFSKILEGHPVVLIVHDSGNATHSIVVCGYTIENNGQILYKINNPWPRGFQYEGDWVENNMGFTYYASYTQLINGTHSDLGGKKWYAVVSR